MPLVEDSVVAAVVERYADLLARRAADIGDRPLVLPNSRFFPDRFDRDEASVARLLARMQAHAGMDDIPVAPRVNANAQAPAGRSCGSGACAAPVGPGAQAPRLMDDGDRWTLLVEEAELGAPVVLTTLLARTLGHVFLIETSRQPSDLPEPLAVAADLSAVALGFGPLLLEGAYIYSKSCGGPQVARATHLSVQELAVATALFIELGSHPARPALKELGATQREALDEALDWVRSNGQLVRDLGASPAAVASGGFELRPPQPWLLRVFGRRAPERRARMEPDLDLSALEASLPRIASSASSPRKAGTVDRELKMLVEEAFAPPRADAE